jgi:hypothetical protein
MTERDLADRPGGGFGLGDSESHADGEGDLGKVAVGGWLAKSRRGWLRRSQRSGRTSCCPTGARGRCDDHRSPPDHWTRTPSRPPTRHRGIHVVNAGSRSGSLPVAVNELVDLVLTVGQERIRACGANPCRQIFVDTSRNGRRPYCSRRCANRVNQSRHRREHG